MILDTLISTTTTTLPATKRDSPSITALNDGGFVVSWEGGDDIYGQRYDAAGVARGEAFRVNTTTTDFQFEPSVTALNDGGFVVSWTFLTLYEGELNIYAQRYDASGIAQGGEFRVNADTSRTQQEPSITALTDGGFVVSWTSVDRENHYSSSIYMRRYDADGVAQSEEFPINTITHFQGEPSITALNNGGFIVSWTASANDSNGMSIYAQRYDASGIAQGGEFRVNTDTNGFHGSSITALNDNGFVVSWESREYHEDDSTNIYARCYDANGVAQGNEFRVNTYTTSFQSESSVTALNDGGFVVSWTSGDQDGDDSGIYAQRYDANGVAQGNEFRVNTYTTDIQSKSSITALNDGGFVVSWRGDNYEIYGKRYDASGNEVEWSISPYPTMPSADRLFNWAENVYPDLFPNHPASYTHNDYRVRYYENGNALGEQNDSIYFYDGHFIALVGTVNDFLPDAAAAGF